MYLSEGTQNRQQSTAFQPPNLSIMSLKDTIELANGHQLLNINVLYQESFWWVII